MHAKRRRVYPRQEFYSLRNKLSRRSLVLDGAASVLTVLVAHDDSKHKRLFSFSSK